MTCAARVRENLTADSSDLVRQLSHAHIDKNVCGPPAEGSLHEEHWKTQKPVIVEDHS